MDAIVGVAETVFIEPSHIYAKTPAALTQLREVLTKKGYTIEPSQGMNGPIVRSWHAKLGEETLQLVFQCSFCKQQIDREIVWRHKNVCPGCQRYTMVRFPPQGTVQFYFRQAEGEPYDGRSLTLEIFDYDVDRGVILFRRPDVATPRGLQARQILDDFQGRWLEIKRGDRTLIAIQYDPDAHQITDETVIEITHATEEQNYQSVYLYDGQEYSSTYGLPVPDSLSIEEAWHWAPLQPSPELYSRILSAGAMSRVDYYYQDGRRGVSDRQLARMHLFVEHLTALDFKRWQKFIQRAPLDGPGFIRAIAKFCHPDSQVADEPNIGNVLVALEKVAKAKQLGLTGIRVSRQEYDAIARALADPECLETTTDLLAETERKHPGSTKAIEGFLDNFRV